MKIEVEEKELEACRPFLAQTLREVRPTRIIAVGAKAANAVFGRDFQPISTRKAYGWSAAYQAFVFAVFHPSAALRNRFVLRLFEEDLQWALTAEPELPPLDVNWSFIRTEEEAERSCEALSKGFAFDVETSGRAWDQEFVLLSFAAAPMDGSCAFVWDSVGLQDARAKPLRKLLTNPAIPKGGQNVKFDTAAVHAGLGVEVAGIAWDTKVIRRLLDPDAKADLATLAELVGMGGHKDEATEALAVAGRQIHQWVKNGKEPPIPLRGEKRALWLQRVKENVGNGSAEVKRYSFGIIPSSVLLRYNARDAVSTALVANVLLKQLQESPVRRVWDELVQAAVPAFAQMERWGIHVDKQAVKAFSAFCEIGLSDTKEQLSVYGDFNPDSSKAVSELLYRQLKLAPTRLTPGGAFSTDAESLEALKGQHPVVDSLLRWRELRKLKGTYADGLLSEIRDDGRVHPSFNIDGARSGRTSCSEPNLQNLPRPTSGEEAKHARDCFVALPGYKLVQLDFSQLELRIAAAITGDVAMREAFLSGEDFHLATAKKHSKVLFGLTPDKVGKKERSTAKTFNFSVFYGKSDFGIAQALGVDEEEARAVRAAIMGGFKQADAWIKRQVTIAHATGECWTYWRGKKFRRRPLTGIGSNPDTTEARKAIGTLERASYNTPIQGTASDYCLASVVETVRWLLTENAPAKLVLTVHDSIMLEVREDWVERVILKVKAIMEGWPCEGAAGPVPLIADVEVGRAWGSLEPMDFGKKTS
jgi:DNA polymerase I-like protein with 3'-5' exonuclease and polymerase domains